MSIDLDLLYSLHPINIGQAKKTSRSEINWIMSWFESIFQEVFESRVSLNQNSGMSFESWVDLNQNYRKLFESWIDLNGISGIPFASWVDLNRISVLAIWVMSQFESNSRKPLRVMSWFESILENHCESWVESESKLSETDLNRIEKIESYPCLSASLLSQMIIAVGTIIKLEG